MALNPSDVANKQFKTNYRGFYSPDEVDAFLDEVESELARLLRENAELRDRAEGAGPLEPGEGQQAALRTLLLAQRTADQAVAEAETEARQTVEAARAEAEVLLAEARDQAATALAQAQNEADAARSAAETEAAGVLDTARAEAARLDADAGERSERVHAEISARSAAALGDLDGRRQELEASVQRLAGVEQEHRARFRGYLRAALDELDAAAPPGVVSDRPDSHPSAEKDPETVLP